MVVMVKYDVLFGAGKTPLRMRINYKNYLTAVKGRVSVRLASSKYARELGLEKDYDAFDFIARNEDTSNAKFLKVDLEPTQSIFIPPHWFYSVEFTDPDAIVVGMHYETAMSVMANAEDYVMRHLQSHNIRYKLPKHISSEASASPPSVETKEASPPSVDTKEDVLATEEKKVSEKDKEKDREIDKNGEKEL